jgi:hypothetical protein
MATYGVTSTSDTEALSQLVAGDEVPIMKEINLKIAAGALSRGTVLEMVATTGTTWQQLTAGSPTNARAILAQDAANNASAVTRVQAYFVGRFRLADILWPAAITSANKIAAITALQDRGIILDENPGDITTTSTTTTTTTTSSSTTTTTAG